MFHHRLKAACRYTLLALTLRLMATSVFFFVFFFPCGFALGQDSGAEFLENAPAASSSAYKKQALLTIFYNASTNGELHPCPT